MQQVSVEDDFGVVYLCDFENISSDPPEHVEDRPAWATPKMIAIAVLHYTDGPTSITLDSEHPSWTASELTHVWEGAIETPSGRVVVVNSYNEILIEYQNPSKDGRVLIFVDRLRNPSQVVILFRECSSQEPAYLKREG